MPTARKHQIIRSLLKLLAAIGGAFLGWLLLLDGHPLWFPVFLGSAVLGAHIQPTPPKQ